MRIVASVTSPPEVVHVLRSLGTGRPGFSLFPLCKSNGWHRFLVAKDWAGFARHYSGPSYADNKYDINLAAYKRHAGQS